MVAKDIHNRAWDLGYKLGLQKLRDHLVENRHMNLRSLDLKSIHPNRIALQVVDSLG